MEAVLEKDRNILDKKDRSHAPTPRARPIPKREKFSWGDIKEQGTFMMLNKNELNIDGAYQRDVGNAKVLRIARDFNWMLFGAISVVLRKDGTAWVYDGGHRIRAAMHRDDVAMIPCLVFELPTDSLQKEAEAFIGTNTMKSKVGAYHLYRAGLISKNPSAVKAQNIVSKYHYSVTRDGNKQFETRAPDTIMRMVDIDIELADRTFGFCAKIASGEPIPAWFLKGSFYLGNKYKKVSGLFDDSWVDNLKKASIQGIGAAARRESIIQGKGGARITAKAMFDLIYKGRKKKPTW